MELVPGRRTEQSDVILLRIESCNHGNNRRTASLGMRPSRIVGYPIGNRADVFVSAIP